MGEFTVLGIIHWVSASVARLVGGIQLFSAKGTPAHRRLGWVYAALLLLVNGTALVPATLLVALGGFPIVGARWWVSHAYVSAGASRGC